MVSVPLARNMLRHQSFVVDVAGNRDHCIDCCQIFLGFDDYTHTQTDRFRPEMTLYLLSNCAAGEIRTRCPGGLHLERVAGFSNFPATAKIFRRVPFSLGVKPFQVATRRHGIMNTQDSRRITKLKSPSKTNLIFIFLTNHASRNCVKLCEIV